MVKTQIIINGVEVQLSEDVIIPITLQSFDVRQIETRKTEFTKTVSIAGTNFNNKLFGYIFDPKVQNGGEGLIDGIELEAELQSLLGSAVDVSNTQLFYNFDPRKKVSAQITYGGVEVLNGYMRLNNISIKNDIPYYECIFYGTLGDIITELGDLVMSELTGDELVHLYNVNGIKNSWDLQLPYKYPFADYGREALRNGAIVPVQSLLPAIRLSYYIEKIFEKVGYTLDAPILLQDPLKDIFVLYNGDGKLNIDESVIETSNGNGSRIETTTLVADNAVNFTANTNLIYTELGQNFLESGFKSIRDGSYNFNFKTTIGVDAFVTQPEEFPLSISDLLTRVRVRKVSNSGVISFIPDNLYNIKATLPNNPDSIVFETNGTNEFFNINYTLTEFMGLPNQWVDTGLELDVTVQINNITLEDGERITVQFQNKSEFANNQRIIDNFSSQFVSGLVRTTYKNTSSDVTLVSQIGINTQLSYQDIALKGVLVKDFFISVLKLFNLVVIPDKVQPKTIRLETKDNYLSTGRFKDWSYKVDKSKNINITPIADADIQEYYYSFQESSDFYNQRYTNSFNRKFGDLLLQSESEFGTQTKTIETIFEPTIVVRKENETITNLVGIRTTGIEALAFTDEIDIVNVQNVKSLTGLGQQITIGNSTHTIIGINRNRVKFTPSKLLPFNQNISDISFVNIHDRDEIQVYQSSDNNLTQKPYSSNPKLVIYGGMQPCNEFVLDDGITTLVEDEYPYFNTINRPPNQNPTFDLNFGRPREVYYPITFYPQRNLFTQFWRNSFRIGISKNSKIYTAFFRLSEQEVVDLRYNDIIYIEGTFYRFNKLMDYNLNKGGVAKVELFQLNDVTVNVGQDIPQFEFIENQLLTLTESEDGFNITLNE